ncbi:hypothetical protein RF11_10267 [Thelohanellus kitauei]|uniref:Uncharacterized protein n=1 Tax=Thelohanellus kitauei TaxID=669202 RepID=A0A0C2JRZ0_THEKT|nr:hypothetical protein RF11_10267 [Thelohanellus kitauei]
MSISNPANFAIENVIDRTKSGFKTKRPMSKITNSYTFLDLESLIKKFMQVKSSVLAEKFYNCHINLETIENLRESLRNGLTFEELYSITTQIQTEETEKVETTKLSQSIRTLKIRVFDLPLVIYKYNGR